MSRSSARGQVEPFAALAAVLALTAAFGVYAVAYAHVPLGGDARRPARTALTRVATALGPLPADPAVLATATRGVDPERSVNVTLRTARARWALGPRRPPTAAVASRSVPVRVGNRTVRPGRLTVAVWS